MSDDQMDHEVDQPIAPPTEPGALAGTGPKTTWSLVIGIIAIVLGALGSLVYAWRAVSVFLMDKFADLMEVDAGISCFACILSILLLVSGILLVKRHPSALRWCVTWSILKIISVIPGSIVGYMNQQAKFEAIAADPNTPMAPMVGTMAKILPLVAIVFGLLWGWALPVFMLIWFSRAKIKSDVAAWR